MGRLRYELLAERAVTDDVRALAGELLLECFRRPDARKRGWILHAPIYRVLTWDGDVLVGQEMGCVVDCTPPIALHGIGDAAVREGWRSRGIAHRMGALLHQEAIRRNADAVLCVTGPLGGAALEHGMERVCPGEVYLRRRLRRDLPLLENWYVRWHGPKVVPLTIDRLF